MQAFGGQLQFQPGLQREFQFTPRILDLLAAVPAVTPLQIVHARRDLIDA